MKKSLREQGNEAYALASANKHNTLVYQEGLLEAIKFYNTALRDDKEIFSSCHKNLGVVSFHLALTYKAKENLLIYYFIQSIQHLSTALALGSLQSDQWKNVIIKTIGDNLEKIQTHSLVMSLSKRKELIAIENSLTDRRLSKSYIDLLLYLLDLYFKHSVELLDQKNFEKACECILKCEEIEKKIQNVLTPLTFKQYKDLQQLKDDIWINKSHLYGNMYLNKANERYKCIMSDVFDMDIVWEVIDHYTQAIEYSNGKAIDIEAISCSYLGVIFKKILKNETKAKDYFYRSITLGLALQINAEIFDWFQVAKKEHSAYQQKIKIDEEIKLEEEKQKLKNDQNLKTVFDSIQKESDETTDIFITYLKKNHILLQPFPTAASTITKPLLLKIIAYYHPDKQDQNNLKQLLICEEITKYLNNHLEQFKL